MGRIAESIDISASPQSIWDYVQDYQHRTEWDTTVHEYRPIGTDKVGKGVSVLVKSSGFPMNEYEAVYVSFEPYKV
jgi:hypothetical protein